MVNTGISGVNGCIGYYVQNTNKLYMLNDTGSVWQGGYAPGSANVIENSYAKIDCAKTTVSGSGNTMTVKWVVTFKEPFVGGKNIYLFVRDDNNAYYGWILKGGWTVNPPPATVVERIYVHMNGQRIAMEETKDGVGKKYFFHNDHLGGTNVVTDEAGQQVKYVEYKPFGETKVEQGSLSVKRKFTGKELDDSTGLYDFLARFYDAKTGRFIMADPVDYSDEGIKVAGGKDLQTFLSNPQNLNRYTYCLNNPIRYLDPDGLVVILISGVDSYQGQKWAGKLKEELIKHGVKQEIYLYSWGPVKFYDFGNKSNEYAKKFIDFVGTLRKQYGSSEPINIFAHSAGSVLLNKALIAGLRVDNVVIAGSPIIRDYKAFGTNTRETYSYESRRDVFNAMKSGWWDDSVDVTFRGYPGIRHKDWVAPWKIKKTETRENILNEFAGALNYYPAINRGLLNDI